MRNWNWLEVQLPKRWGFLLRVLVKALLLFGLCNLSFALVQPQAMEWLGQWSLYNTVLPGRVRLPYGENPAQSYNVSVNNLSALFAAHVISRPKADDEFRVLLLGDSATWGWRLSPDETLSAVLNDADHAVNGKRVRVYNLAYPILSLTKDLLLLDEAMQYAPDMIVWLFTLESFPPDKQTFSPLVQQNADRTLALQQRYGLAFVDENALERDDDLWRRSFFGQRRALMDLLRLQAYGFSWAATGIDQSIPEHYEAVRRDFTADVSWQGYEQPTPLAPTDLAFDVLAAGIERAADIPVLLVNEPMFISDGANSELHYNHLAPRWVYDSYRALLAQIADENDWRYLDLWDTISPDEFTDSPVHLTPAGTRQLADLLSEAIVQERP